MVLDATDMRAGECVDVSIGGALDFSFLWTGVCHVGSSSGSGKGSGGGLGTLVVVLIAIVGILVVAGLGFLAFHLSRACFGALRHRKGCARLRIDPSASKDRHPSQGIDPSASG